MTNDEKALREQLVRLLDWDSAHARFDDSVKDFPVEMRGTRPAGGPHSAWELLEHLRITLWDILEFSRDAGHVSPEWPSGYWPATEAPPTTTAWDESAAAYRLDLRALAELAGDESVNLYARIPHGDGQTILREIVLATDHNAYHVGQLMMVRRMLGA
ncbi:MAG: DinB family protein [Thermoanaerobaculia bacterium]